MYGFSFTTSMINKTYVTCSNGTPKPLLPGISQTSGTFTPFSFGHCFFHCFNISLCLSCLACLLLWEFVDDLHAVQPIPTDTWSPWSVPPLNVHSAPALCCPYWKSSIISSRTLSRRDLNIENGSSLDIHNPMSNQKLTREVRKTRKNHDWF